MVWLLASLLGQHHNLLIFVWPQKLQHTKCSINSPFIFKYLFNSIEVAQILRNQLWPKFGGKILRIRFYNNWPPFSDTHEVTSPDVLKLSSWPYPRDLEYSLLLPERPFTWILRIPFSWVLKCQWVRVLMPCSLPSSCPWHFLPPKMGQICFHIACFSSIQMKVPSSWKLSSVHLLLDPQCPEWCIAHCSPWKTT